MSSRVVIGLGSNLGNKVEHLRAGLRHLTNEGVKVLRLSCLYDSPPQYVEAQPRFLNAAALVATSLSPAALLALAKQAERQAGRDTEGGPRHGPRPLDIDLLCYDDVVLDTPTLTLPHPGYRERAFVLGPVADLVAPPASS